MGDFQIQLVLQILLVALFILVPKGLKLLRKNKKNSNKHFIQEPINRKHKNIQYEFSEWKNQLFHDYNKEEKVHITNEKKLVEKLRQLRKDGLENVQIAADFDHTITAFYQKGNPQILVPATMGCFRRSSRSSQKLEDQMRKNFEKYYPIERDNNISFEQKKKAMDEWNDLTEQQFLEENLEKQKVYDIMNECDLTIRYGFKQFFQNCFNNNIPFYVVSGGIDIFVSSLLNSILNINTYRNFFLYANKFIFNRKNKLVDVQMIIDATNKCDILQEKDFEFFENTVVLGDANHDYLITQKMGSKIVLGILFMKPEQQKQIHEFEKEGWDIIIIGEGNYLIHQEILKFISHRNDHINIEDNDQKNFLRNENYVQIREVMNQARI